MHIDQIISNLAALNEASPAPAKKKKKPAAPAATQLLTADQLLGASAARIVAALDLGKQGVTTESLVESVRYYESAGGGSVQ